MAQANDNAATNRVTTFTIGDQKVRSKLHRHANKSAVLNRALLNNTSMASF